MELLDEVQIRAINLANGKTLPEVPTLMFEFVGTGKRVLVVVLEVLDVLLFDC